MRLAVGLTAVLAAAALAVGVNAVPAQVGTLVATVGPGFTISLRDAAGATVRNLDPGTYTIEVRDLSAEHNFRLSGPGVNRATEIGETGTVTWTVTLEAGTYRFVCDPHAGTMNGSFTVGGGSTPPPTPPPGVITPKAKLQLTSGPGFSIRLRTAAGKTVRSMRTGTYTVTVRDRSSAHNAHVIAPGFNRATSVPRTGTRTWKVKLAKAGTFRFVCDPHRAQMKGSAKIVR